MLFRRENSDDDALVTKRQATRCRRFDVVAAAERDKREEISRELSAIVNFVAQLARESSRLARKERSSRLGVGKNAAVWIRVVRSTVVSRETA